MLAASSWEMPYRAEMLRCPCIRSMARWYRRNASALCSRSVSSVTATVTNGLPSRSPPIQLPKRRKVGMRKGVVGIVVAQRGLQIAMSLRRQVEEGMSK